MRCRPCADRTGRTSPACHQAAIAPPSRMQTWTPSAEARNAEQTDPADDQRDPADSTAGDPASHHAAVPERDHGECGGERGDSDEPDHELRSRDQDRRVVEGVPCGARASEIRRTDAVRDGEHERQHRGIEHHECESHPPGRRSPRTIAVTDLHRIALMPEPIRHGTRLRVGERLLTKTLTGGISSIPLPSAGETQRGTSPRASTLGGADRTSKIRLGQGQGLEEDVPGCGDQEERAEATEWVATPVLRCGSGCLQRRR